MIEYVVYMKINNRKQSNIQREIKNQQKIVENKMVTNDWVFKREFIETKWGISRESKLIDAIEYCKEIQSSLLIIPKIRKLTRSLTILERLNEHQIDFLILDNIQISKDNVYSYIIKIKEQKKKISQNIRFGIKNSKKKIGNHDNNAESLQKYINDNGNDQAVDKIKRNADEYALKMIPIILEINYNGHNSLREIGNELERRKVRTPRGKIKWHKTSVKILLSRIEKLKWKMEVLNDLSDLI